MEEHQNETLKDVHVGVDTFCFWLISAPLRNFDVLAYFFHHPDS